MGRGACAMQSSRSCKMATASGCRFKRPHTQSGSLQTILAQLFLRLAGVSYQRLASALRMARAAELLETTDLTVAATAARLGYSQSAHFVRGFKAACLVTPSQYREIARDAACHNLARDELAAAPSVQERSERSASVDFGY